MTNAVMKPLLKLFGVEEQHVLSPFCCNVITKDDMRKAVEYFFP